MDDTSVRTRLTREYRLRHPFVSAGMGFGFGPASTPEHVQVCLDAGISLVVFHHDPPPADWVRRLAVAGTRVWMQVSSVELADAAVELGVHGLVAQGREAGGHTRATVPLAELLGQLRRAHPDTLLLAAGGISEGTAVAAALRAGADGVWVGTRLVASEEAYAHPEYKERLVRSTGATVSTTAFGPEWPGQAYRLLATPLVREHPTAAVGAPLAPSIGHTRLFPHSVDQPYEMPQFCTRPRRRRPAAAGIPWPTRPGRGVAAVRAVAPAAEIIAEMMAEARAELDRDRAGTGPG